MRCERPVTAPLSGEQERTGLHAVADRADGDIAVYMQPGHREVLGRDRDPFRMPEQETTPVVRHRTCSSCAAGVIDGRRRPSLPGEDKRLFARCFTLAGTVRPDHATHACLIRRCITDKPAYALS